MPTLNIGGQKIKVGDEFLSLSPEQQNAAVDEISKSLPSAAPGAEQIAPSAPEQPAPDKYQQAAVAERDALKAKGVDTGAGLTRRAVQGATFNLADEALAGLSTPLEMIKRGTFDPREGYKYAKAREDLIMDDARKNTGVAGTAAELAGGLVSGSGLANAGITASRILAPEAGLAARSLASAADAGAMGAVAGAAEGNSLGERAGNALTGGALGGVIGGAAPGVLKVAGAALSPIVSNVAARANPEGYATRQVARAIMESGQSPRQIAQGLADANAAGQGVFTVADAMGNPGQRMLSTVARSPGQGRTDLVNFLEGRQAGQGDRISQTVDEALGANATARQTTAQLTKTAQDESAPLYREALDQKPVWNERIQQFFDDPVTKAGLKEGVAVQRLESLAQGKKFDPNDYAITGFNDAGDPIISGVPNMRTINLIKKGWDNQLEKYRDGTTGKLRLDEYGRALDSVRRSFLKEVDAVNPDYAKARQLYAGPAQVRDAVAAGGKAVGRGRAADNVEYFNSLSGPSKQGFRTGYADKISQRAENSAFGVNKARPLTSDKAGAELRALSLHQGPIAPGQLDPLSQRLAREQTMFETRNQAIGGSRTADNINDDAAMSVDPSIIGHLLTGNVGGVARGVLSAGRNALTGNTPEVRAEVGRLLTMRGGNVSQQQLQGLLDEAVRRIQVRRVAAAMLGRGAAGALADAPSAAGFR